MKKIPVIILMFLIYPSSIFAASLSFDANKTASIGEEIKVSLILRVNEEINALSSMIKFNPSVMSVERIIDGGSPIVLWVERPLINMENGTISFSGVTPGGFQGNKEIFSFIIKPLKSGIISMSIGDSTLLKNDGNGTSVEVDKNAFAINVNASTSDSKVENVDSNPPENFLITITKDDELFEGKKFATFGTTDKETGVDHYEYGFSIFGKPGDSNWTQTESPLILEKSSSFKKIYIKAVDRNGNERIVHIAGSNYYATLFISAIIIMLIICIPLSRKRLRD
jgi:hypothetical protein